jgi:rare lipoprotein A
MLSRFQPVAACSRVAAAALLGCAVLGCSARAPLDPPHRPDPVIAAVPDRVTAPAPDPIGGEGTALPLDMAEGEATYYASYFDGRRTANGTVFRNDEYFAAHRTYPFGTLLRVTSLVNQRSVTVLVVDRGPHGTSPRARATIIDLSQRAAAELDFIRRGRIPVRVEVLSWGS